MSNVIDFRVARETAQDMPPADLALAQQIYAPYKTLPLSREAEVILRQIQEKQAQIARIANDIRWLRMSLETT